MQWLCARTPMHGRWSGQVLMVPVGRGDKRNTLQGVKVQAACGLSSLVRTALSWPVCVKVEYPTEASPTAAGTLTEVNVPKLNRYCQPLVRGYSTYIWLIIAGLGEKKEWPRKINKQTYYICWHQFNLSKGILVDLRTLHVRILKT